MTSRSENIIIQTTQPQISNDSGYMSTPMFVNSLTTLCETVLKDDQKEKTLMDGLDALNAELPAKVYLPFIKESIRNYYILHI